MILSWGARVSEDFCNRVVALCRSSFSYDDAPNDLMACMAFESGGTFRADIKNAAGSGAIGLIQFMPSIATDLGTSTYALSLMSPEDQLSYVRSYFRPYFSRIHSLSDMYMAILMPKYVAATDQTKVFLDGTIAYKQNLGLDTNRDGQVTKGEICARLLSKKYEGFFPSNSRELSV